MSQGLEFKFRYVRDGDKQGLMSRKGLADKQGLTLGEDRLPYEYIFETTTRDKRLVLVVSPQTPLTGEAAKYLNGQVLVLEVYKVKAAELEKVVDRACSIQAAARNKERLLEENKGELFRTVVCPECKAMVDVSELSETRYVYCRFCESVVRDRGTATRGADYRTCDECGYFNRVKAYTEFYFYFLLVVYGFSYKRRHLCDNCVGPIFWKALLVNLIFILGVPAAIYMKIKSMVGRDPTFKELNKATKLSRKGRYAEAAPYYRRLHQTHADHPGLYFNEGLGHLQGGDGEGASRALERSLESCSNFLPTIQLFHALQVDGEEG